jgi:probable rRNA maturation factor
MISIKNESRQTFNARLLEQAAITCLELSGAVDADLTIVLTGNDQIHALNQTFLDHDADTDVLSFPAHETDPETGRLYLGDVIISMEQAGAQAEDRGHPKEDEIQLLVVHGVLHLLGHDHAETEEKSRMWSVQAEILERLGISPNIVHE